jgi:fructose-1,6-bisphosphatase-3
MQFMAKRGSTYLKRDHALIFHACVPVDEEGNFLSLEVLGKELKGRALFEALNVYVQRAFSDPASVNLDLFWYLWSGWRSPWFGKDKMATFETYYVADKDTHHETKNHYFSLIHDKIFCDRVLAEFGMNHSDGIIVNGHVPVKIEKGESPLKRSGKAITIDGAFSQAYGDKGYTLILDAEHTYLAQHHHFESVEDAIEEGSDIIPTIQELFSFRLPHRQGDTEVGEDRKDLVRLLTQLLQAYRDNAIKEEMP